MKVDRTNPTHWLLLLRQGAWTVLAIIWRRLRRRPAKPRVVLYGHQFGGNLKALYEEWEKHYRASLDCRYLSLDPQAAAELERAGIRVLRCGRLRDMLWVARCRAIVTDHGLHAMAPLVSCTDIRFIDVWHGIPFKGFIPDQFRLQHRYDEVWVSSPLLREMYGEKFGFDAAKVRDLGYARVDKLFRKDPPSPSYRSEQGLGETVRIVLYAPTWKQDDNNRDLFPFGQSQQAFLGTLDPLCGAHNAILLVRSHLNASIGAAQFEHVRYCSMGDFPDTESLLRETDILICDWSSIAFDYLALDRPAIFLDVEPPFANGFSLGPEYRFGYIADDMAALCRQLGDTLKDPVHYAVAQAGTHKRITDAVYGNNIDGQSARRQWQRLLELCD